MGSAPAGDFAERIAATLWRDLELVRSGSPDDFSGMDARGKNGRIIQIKYDSRADETGNLYWEIAKRNDGSWNSYGRSNWWHMTPSRAHEYVFVSEDKAYRVSVGVLVRTVVELGLRPLSTKTSLAFLVPIADLAGPYEARDLLPF